MLFNVERNRHAVLQAAADRDAGTASDLWNAITDQGESPADSWAEAVRDTVPATFGPLLATEPVAAAYAFGLLDRSSPPTTRPAWRQVATAQSAKLRDGAREIWKIFVDKAESVEAVSEGLGWDRSDAWTTLRDPALARDVAMVERVAKMAGRMYAALRGAKARKVAGIPTQVYSVEQGREIGRLLPSEQVLLTDPDFENLLGFRLVTSTAAQYKVRGDGKKSQGPLVLVLDESGSMGAGHGTAAGPRNEWAKAAAVAMARVATESGRPVVVVHFSTSVKVQTIKPGKISPVAATELITTFLGGGNDIAMALHAGLAEVRTLATKGANGADIVLVTDGVDGTDHAGAVATMKCAAVRLWTVAIEVDITGPLRDYASSYIPLAGAALQDGAVLQMVGAA